MKGYKIRGKVAVMDSPTNIVNPFDTQGCSDQEIMAEMVRIFRADCCEYCDSEAHEG